MMKDVRVKKVEGNDALLTSEAEWQTLFAVSDCSPFLSWEWLNVWLESFGDGKSPMLLKAYRGDALIAILPMFREKKRLAAMRFDRVALLGEGVGGADHLDIISRPEDRAAAMTAIFDYINISESADVLCLENLDNGSVTTELLRDLSLRAGLRFNRFSSSISAVCPQIDLAEGWAAVLANSKREDNFRRKLKKLEKMPGFEFRSVTSPNETGDAFERFLHLHQKRWEKEGGSELSGHPRLISFQRSLVSKLSCKGLIRFDELWKGGECLSSIYGLDSGKTFYYYNSGYDQDFSKLSVGLVLLGLSVKSAIERGVTLYDFLRGDEAYKSDWANCRTELVNFRFSRPKLAVIVSERVGNALGGLKDALKSKLPVGLTERVANRRRSLNRKYQLSGR